MRIVFIIVCAVAATSSMGCTIVIPASTAAPHTTATAPSPVATAALSHPAPPRQARHLYRLDFAIAGPGTDASTNYNGTYTMNLEEGRHGELVSGANTSLAPAGNLRTDIGVKIKAIYAMSGEDLLIETDAEMNAVDEPTGSHKIVTRSCALVSPGKPALLASADDARGKKRYQLTVAATKLR